ncbi:MAG: hypothetical protein ACREDR_42900 [Blastocatellia bacterium]
MRRAIAGFFVVFVGLMAACGPVSSLNPLFTNKDVVFDAGLLGDWMDGSSDGSILRFERDQSTGYRIIDTEFDQNGSTKQTAYRAHLVSLDGRRFLDVVPEQLDVQATLPQMTLGDRQIASQRGYLSRLGDGVYFELSDNEAGAAARASIKQAHWIFNVRSDSGALRLASLDEDWLKKAIDHGQVAISNVATMDDEHEVVLTAETADLQRFVLEHADDPDAFPQLEEWRRLD